MLVSMSTSNSSSDSRYYQKLAFWLAFLAAILYCSWPLGYLLNPIVGEHQLASQLEAPHQPFNWLFIAMDVLTGVVIAIVGAKQLKHKRHLLLDLSIASYVLFGLCVLLAAALPLDYEQLRPAH
jgi:hypothetical protein